jgi:uncharacterized protein (TIGR03435 family)
MKTMKLRVFVYLGAGLLGWAMAAPVLSAAAEFEVASVKPQKEPLSPGAFDLSWVGTAGKPFKITGNRVLVRGTLHRIIADAYGVKTYQVTALPDWADSLLWVINAESPGTAEPTQDQVRPMLQALLADRFHLKFHRDGKEVPVYYLVQTKKTAAFHAALPEETFSWNMTAEPNKNSFRSKATKESIGDFVQLTGVSADRPLIDKTGIAGDIDYDILVSLDGVKTPDDQQRAILDAIKEQLGFKLEPARDKIDLLVIDHSEKASEN